MGRGVERRRGSGLDVGKRVEVDRHRPSAAGELGAVASDVVAEAHHDDNMDVAGRPPTRRTGGPRARVIRRGRLYPQWMAETVQDERIEALLEGLNPPQREAVTHGDGPLLIL